MPKDRANLYITESKRVEDEWAVQDQPALRCSMFPVYRTLLRLPLRFWSAAVGSSGRSGKSSGNIEHSESTWFVPDTVLSSLQISPYLILMAILLGRCYYYPHFTDEKTKPEWLRNLSKEMNLVGNEWGFKPRQAGLGVWALQSSTLNYSSTGLGWVPGREENVMTEIKLFFSEWRNWSPEEGSLLF